MLEVLRHEEGKALPAINTKIIGGKGGEGNISSDQEMAKATEVEDEWLSFLISPGDFPEELQRKVYEREILITVTEGDHPGFKCINICDDKKNVLFHSENEPDPHNLIPLQ